MPTMIEPEQHANPEGADEIPAKYWIPTSALLGFSAGMKIVSYFTVGMSLALFQHHPLQAIALTPSDFFIWVGRKHLYYPTIVLIVVVSQSIAVPSQYILGKRAIASRTKREPRFLKQKRLWLNQQRDRLMAHDSFRHWGYLLIIACPTIYLIFLAGSLRMSRFWTAVCSTAGKAMRVLIVLYFGLVVATLTAYIVYPIAISYPLVTALRKRIELRTSQPISTEIVLVPEATP